MFIGQLATSGRVKVTALGDEVNECARIEHAAGGGQVLTSKSVIERLSDDDAQALGLDVERVVYRTVAELPNADEKARRDAGAVAVVDLRGLATRSPPRGAPPRDDDRDGDHDGGDDGRHDRRRRMRALAPTPKPSVTQPYSCGASAR